MNSIILSSILAVLLLYILNCFQKQEIERLKKLEIKLRKSIQELSCNEEELELLNNILGSDK